MCSPWRVPSRGEARAGPAPLTGHQEPKRDTGLGMGWARLCEDTGWAQGAGHKHTGVVRHALSHQDTSTQQAPTHCGLDAAGAGGGVSRNRK